MLQAPIPPDNERVITLQAPVKKEKETPMERLKRLRAAQLNKTFQKEVMTAAQRKLQEEKDRAARESLQRAAWRRSPSPPSPRCPACPRPPGALPVMCTVLPRMPSRYTHESSCPVVAEGCSPAEIHFQSQIP